jgi:hypothetical protein
MLPVSVLNDDQSAFWMTPDFDFGKHGRQVQQWGYEGRDNPQIGCGLSNFSDVSIVRLW